MTLSSDSTNTLTKWERLRIFYNIILAVVLIVSSAFFRLMFGRSIYLPNAFKWILAGAVMANVCFCTAPVVDFYSELVGLRFRGKRILIFSTGTFIASALVFITVCQLFDPFDHRPFNRSVWIAQTNNEDPDNPRAKMVGDLQRRFIKWGTPCKRVIELLGEPDFMGPDNEYEYILGMWSGFRMDYDTFNVYFDSDGLVTGTQVVQH
jgi:hypothetical protein